MKQQWQEGYGEYPIKIFLVTEITSQTNKKYYLFSGGYDWTLSPSYFSDRAYMMGIDQFGAFFHTMVLDSRGIRPVINLRSDVKLTGTGTMTDPYIVE